jgi:hypothetical protein
MGFIEEATKEERRYNTLPSNIKAEFDHILWQFSPENLTCDGELSKGQVAIKLRGIKKAWKNLEEKHNVRFNPAYLV